jgi:nickel superoxide dismutase
MKTIAFFARAAAAAACAALLAPALALAHCEVPCGIYDDPARIAQLREDAATIEKAIAGINELTGRHDALSANQLTRWVVTKEEHASHIQETIAVYFLSQRVKPVEAGKPGYEEYLAKVAAHHLVMVAAMKTKQNTDPSTVADLRMTIDAIAKYYPPAEPEAKK